MSSRLLLLAVSTRMSTPTCASQRIVFHKTSLRRPSHRRNCNFVSAIYLSKRDLAAAESPPLISIMAVSNAASATIEYAVRHLAGSALSSTSGTASATASTSTVPCPSCPACLSTSLSFPLIGESLALAVVLGVYGLYRAQHGHFPGAKGF
jgi:hypothetical protein